jgi:hypothetical protein
MLSQGSYTPYLKKYTKYRGANRSITFWHPDLEMAEEWIKYHQKGE